MSAGSTPGPWEVDCSGLGAWIMAGGPMGVHVATIPIARDGDWSEANARLIAAAPDMLAVVSELLERGEASWSLLNKARAAIAKAEGK